MIDIRYHIYSLAAVFFALAVGIVVGASFAGRTPAGESGRKTIARYEGSMRGLKQEIEKATQERRKTEDIAKNSEEYCRALLPIVAKSKLAWRNVAIIQTGDYDELSGYVKHAAELAGANVTSTTDLNRKFPFQDNAKVAEALNACGIVPPTDPREARDKLFGIIAETVYSDRYAQLLSQLEDADVAKFTGDYSRFNKLVVIVGGTNSRNTAASENLDIPLIAQLQKRGVTVVGCEGSGVVGSCITLWHKMGIATVDNADSAMGQMAIICALNGENAQFGVKETADRLIPQTLETK